MIDPQACKTLADVEREHIERVLAACDGNRTRAAKLLGINVRTLQRRAKKANSAAICPTSQNCAGAT